LVLADKLTLITKAEDPTSAVDAKEAAEFLMKVQKGTEMEVERENVEEDLLADIL